MPLSLSDILTRAKYYYPSTLRDTELTGAILERMNYLVSLDIFPFQENYLSTTLVSGEYRLSTPSNFAILKGMTIWQTGTERQIVIKDPVEFDRLFPMPSDLSPGPPTSCCVKVAEGEFWFNCPADIDYTIRAYFTQIPDDATNQTVSQMVELAKLVLAKWTASDGYRMDREYDTADRQEMEGNKFLAALKRRYQLAQEQGMRFISPKEEMVMSRMKYSGTSKNWWS